MDQGRQNISQARLLWAWPAAAGLTWVTAGLIARGTEPFPPRSYLVALAGCATLCAHALFPGAPRSLLSRLIVPAAWGASVMGGALALQAASLPWPIPWQAALRLAAGVGVLTLLLDAATEASSSGLEDRPGNRRVVWAVFGLAGVAPLWLGPAAERLADSPPFVNGVVAASPLTYLAILADVDYFRTTWFYENCALGSLRYDYPAPAALTAGYLTLGAALLAFAALKCRRRANRQEVSG